MGDFRIIDALATLAFDFPASHPRAAERSQYFRGELEQFLAFHRAERTSPLAPRGSYAGAWGMPQFMPSSLARWGVDYDGDKKVDLAGSTEDVIGSVANYFKGFGWIPGMPTHYPVHFDTGRLDLDALLAPDILPTFTVARFQEKGAVLEGPALEHKGPLALIELQNGGEPPSYVAGTENFYVITRYNWSSYYAMAVRGADSRERPRGILAAPVVRAGRANARHPDGAVQPAGGGIQRTAAPLPHAAAPARMPGAFRGRGQPGEAAGGSGTGAVVP
jgi:membrane-bound lytic murein transglycosylase B